MFYAETTDEEAQVPLKGEEEKEEEEEEENSDEYGSQVDLENPKTLVQSTPDLETMILPRRISEAHGKHLTLFIQLQLKCNI